MKVSMSDRSIQRVLHSEPQFSPHKIAVLEELLRQDFAVRPAACETLTETLP